MVHALGEREAPLEILTARLEAQGKDTTAAFLSRCDPPVSEMFGYWQARRGPDGLVPRSAIEPAQLRRHLPGIVIVGVRQDPVDYVYRLVGTRACEAHGRDTTGKRVAEAYFGSSLDATLANYDYVRRSRAFLYHQLRDLSTDGRWMADATLYLPLMLGSGAVDQILVYVHFRDLWG